MRDYIWKDLLRLFLSVIIASGQPADNCYVYVLGLVLSANTEVAPCGSVEGKDVHAGFRALIFKQTYCAGYMQHFFH